MWLRIVWFNLNQFISFTIKTRFKLKGVTISTTRPDFHAAEEYASKAA